MKRILCLATASVFLWAAPAFSAGDAAKGEKVYKKCAVCHAVGVGAKNKLGPVLTGIVGGRAAANPDFKYSPALKKWGAGGNVWDEESLSAYLKNPRGFIKGGRMVFPGLKKDDEIADVIAYLKTFE